jgi:hypothetical protein
MEVRDELHISAALSAMKSLRYPLDRRLGVPQSRYGRRGGDKYPCHRFNLTCPDVVIHFSDSSIPANALLTAALWINFSAVVEKWFTATSKHIWVEIWFPTSKQVLG